MNKTRAQRERLKGFLDDMLVGLGRSERRQWGDVYVRGLLTTSGRRTIVSMATQAAISYVPSPYKSSLFTLSLRERD
jgi:hypothetical protein